MDDTGHEIPFNDMSDLQLTDYVKEGSREAFQELYIRHISRVTAVIFKITKNHHDTEELSQEVFIKAFKKIHSFTGKGSFQGWISRIASNQALEKWRKNQRTPTHLSDDFLLDNSQSKSAAPDKKLRLQEMEGICRDVINELPEEFREIFVLAVIEKMPYQEISDLTGLTVSLIKVRVFRARNMMKKALKDYL